MKLFSLSALAFAAMCSVAGAQDLDTQSITDQFNTGSRGNSNGTLTFGGSAIDGSQYTDYIGADATSTTGIRYINTWAGASFNGEVESPVLDVTVAHAQVDRQAPTQIPALPANNLAGASNGSMAVSISDDGGFNSLFFGESNDKNYYVEVDVYCFTNRPGYETVALGARAGRDNDTSMTEHSYNLDRAGSYAIVYDSQLNEAKAGKWRTGNSQTDITGRVAGAFTQFGSTISNVTAGWHRMRIECNNQNIQFSFDGSVIATVVDSTFTHGRPGLHYRENVATASEYAGHFDNLKAGPATISDVRDWSMY